MDLATDTLFADKPKPKKRTRFASGPTMPSSSDNPAASRGDLLASIRRGQSLKHVSAPEEKPLPLEVGTGGVLLSMEVPVR